jgi:serine phosphatase RsbU (regulator of sigma subunit)
MTGAPMTGAARSERLFPGGIRADGLPAALSDPRRLAAVAATGLLDTGPEAVFDDLAELAASVTGCGRAFITLVDADRSYWKSCIGVPERATADRQTTVQESFCMLLIGLGDRLVIEDAATDRRTRDHPSVRPMKIGAWAGYPIRSEAGEILGSFCVIDENPHSWQPAELAALGTLARAASNEINLRRSLAVAHASLQEARAVARSLQDSLLPPVLEPVPGLETAASYLPAAGGTTITGDFYDLFHVRGPWWCAVMGDVCGKGTEAAKVTALARYTLRAAASHHLSPAVILRQLNAALIDQYRADRYLTVVQATFRVTSGGMAGRLCTAGHPPALVLRAGGDVQEIGRPGTVLGFFPGVEVTDVRFRLAPGDALLLYTDGVTEARARAGAADAAGAASAASADRPMFGDEALSQALADCRGQDAASIVGHIGDVVSRHSGNWASDDTALLVLRVPQRPR